jgi:hypothetical protein
VGRGGAARAHGCRCAATRGQRAARGGAPRRLLRSRRQPAGAGAELWALRPTAPFRRLLPSGGDALQAKVAALLELLAAVSFHQAVVFCNNKQHAEWLAQRLTAAAYPAAYLSGSRAQEERMGAMAALRAFKLRVGWGLGAGGCSEGPRLGRCAPGAACARDAARSVRSWARPAWPATAAPAGASRGSRPPHLTPCAPPPAPPLPGHRLHRCHGQGR